MRQVNIGIVGLGTVGGGLVRLLQHNHDHYVESFGVDLRLKKGCALDPNRGAELNIPEECFTLDWHDVVNDPEIDIVVELVGGYKPCLELLQTAIKNGKHVVTANKALLAREMGNLAGLAHDNGVQIKCEAAAAGGIPIVETLEHALVGNRILTIAGIMNGTTNYMLTRMKNEGLSFDEVLADAQRLGYAEADPTADVDGLDAAAKIAILATIGFNTRVTMDDVSTIEGIRSVDAKDVAYAGQLGYVVKLLAVARQTPDGLDVRVHPAMISCDHQLARVDGVFNAVYVVGDAVGETMYLGAGAGSFPTASAVMGDVLALATPIAAGVKPQAEAEPFKRTQALRESGDLMERYYVRLEFEDRVGILGEVASILGECGVSLEQVNQPAHADDEPASLVVVTHIAKESDVLAALRRITETEGIARVASLIRVEDTEAWLQGTLA